MQRTKLLIFLFLQAFMGTLVACGGYLMLSIGNYELAALDFLLAAVNGVFALQNYKKLTQEV